MHGKASTMTNDGEGVYAGLPSEFQRHPLPLPGHRARELPQGARRHLALGGRRDHGRSSPRAGRHGHPARGRAVPPGIDSFRARARDASQLHRHGASR
jgi:hypothetical protein